MRRHILFTSLVASLCALAVPVGAAEPDTLKPTISVASSGKVTAKPELAIVFLSTRSSAPLAADALDQNRKKVQDVKARLTAMGYKERQVRYSDSRFSPAGQGMYYSGGQRPTGFDVYTNFYVFLDAEDLKNVDEFNTKVSLLLDELSKLGASPSAMPISSMSMGGASVIAFTVKDASAYEKEAYVQAMDKSRSVADDIARRMKVQITGVEAVNSSTLTRTAMVGPSSPLDDLPYEYLSSSMSEVAIRVRVDVRYAYK
jgi:uncharacterized protein YggE